MNMKVTYALKLKGTAVDEFRVITNDINGQDAYIIVRETLTDWGFDDSEINFFVRQVLVRDVKEATKHTVNYRDGRKVILYEVPRCKHYFEPEGE